MIEIKRAVYKTNSYDESVLGNEIIKAAVPTPLLKKSMATPSTVAYVMHEKYVMGVPLYRQEKCWKDKGVALSRATLSNWIVNNSMLYFKPFYEELKKILLKEPVINADETVVQVLKEENRKASEQSRMWLYSSSINRKISLFEYCRTRAGENPKKYLRGFNGYLQTDGYAGYNLVENATLCGCFAHMRRNWDEALPKSSEIIGSKAKIGLDYCNSLFKIEQEFKEKGLTYEQIKEERQVRSKPVLDEYFAWVKTLNPPANSNLYKAVTYAVNQQINLERFLDDGSIEISNNKAENAIRPFVIGRKNWLFSNTPKGAEASAIIYSIIETAKANELNIYSYITYLLTALPAAIKSGNFDNVLPWYDKLPNYHKKTL